MNLKLLQEPEAFIVSKDVPERAFPCVPPPLQPPPRAVGPRPRGTPVTAETAALGQLH